MISGGTRHTGGPGLAVHLAKVENGEVKLVASADLIHDDDLEVTAENLQDLVRQMKIDAMASRTQKPLYHSHFNPDPRDADLSKEMCQRYIELFQEEFGVEQFFAVQHEKDGRYHVHLVARFTDEYGKVLNDSKDYARREKLSRMIEIEFAEGYGRELHLTKGRHNRAVIESLQTSHPEMAQILIDAGLDTGPRPQSSRSPEERQQEMRTGVDALSIHNLTAAAWTQSDDYRSFAAALDAAGLVLAEGTKTSVVVDRTGNTHSLLRSINIGLKEAGSERILKKNLDARLPADLPPLSVVVDQVKNQPADADLAPVDPIVPKTGNPFLVDPRFELDMRRAAPTHIPDQLTQLLEETRRAKTPEIRPTDAVDAVDLAGTSEGDRADRHQDRRPDAVAGKTGDQLGRVDPGSAVGDQRADQAAGRSADRTQNAAGSDPVRSSAVDRIPEALAPKSPSPTASTGRKGKSRPAMVGGGSGQDEKKVSGVVLEGDPVDNTDWSKLSPEQKAQRMADLDDQRHQKWLQNVKKYLAANEEEKQQMMARIRRRQAEFDAWLSSAWTQPASRNHLKHSVGDVGPNRADSSENLLDEVQKYSFEKDALQAFSNGVEPLFAPSAAGRYHLQYTEIALDLARMSPSDLNDLRMVTAANFKDLGAVNPKTREAVRFERELTRCGLTVIEDVMCKRRLISSEDRMTTTQLKNELLIYPDSPIEGDVFEVSRVAIEQSILDQIDGNQVNHRQLDHLIKTDPAAFRRAMNFVSKKVDEIGEDEWAAQTRRRLQKHGVDSKNPDQDPDYTNKPGM